MISTIFVLTAILNLCNAQTSIVSIPLPGADQQPLVASFISSDATATTYFVQCAPGTDSDDCGIIPMTMTEGPSIAAYTIQPQYDTANGSSAVAFTAYQSCQLHGTTSAICVESNGGYEANFPGSSTVTYTGTDLDFMPLTITAGLGAVNTAASSTAVSSSGVSSTSAVSSGTARETGVGLETSTGSLSAKTSGTSSISAVSTGGVPAVTYPAMLAVGGAAVAMMVMG